MSTSQFLKKFNSGGLGDDQKWFDWLYIYEAYSEINNELQLFQRWDNAPHHKEIKTFPYHIHTPQGILESSPINFIKILEIISHLLTKRLSINSST